MDTLPSGFDPQDPTDIIAGRRFPYHTAGDWVYLAVDPQTGKRIPQGAKAMYSTLRMHINHGRHDSVVWPGTDALAEIAGLSRGDKVKPHVDPLVRIGAVEVHVVRFGERKEKTRNFYVVHEAPPEGYTGWLSLADFYAARKKLRKDMEETGEHLGYVTAPGAPEKRVPGLTSENTVPRMDPPKTGSPGTPKTGGPDTPKMGDQPQQPPEQKQGGEEEAAHAREESISESENEPLRAPTVFALAVLRAIIDTAPQTSGQGGRLPETIGEPEIIALACAFDAETQLLAEYYPDDAGGRLQAWISRGLGTADSLFGVLRHRLRAGHATSKLVPRVKRKKPSPATTESPGVQRTFDMWTCPDHDEATPGHCPACEATEERLREERSRATRSGADAARLALANTRETAGASGQG